MKLDTADDSYDTELLQCHNGDSCLFVLCTRMSP
jgi:hypothetical protein